MPSRKAQLAVIFPDDAAAWIEARSQSLGISRGEVVRRAVDEARAGAPGVHALRPITQNLQETEMPKPREEVVRRFNGTVQPGRKKAKYDASNPMPAELRVEPKKTRCPRCQRDVWADESGQPRPHQRAATPMDDVYSDLVPTMTECLSPDGLD